MPATEKSDWFPLYPISFSSKFLVCTGDYFVSIGTVKARFSMSPLQNGTLNGNWKSG